MADKIAVELSGPLFAKNVTTTIRGAQNKLLARVAEHAKREVKAQLTKGHGKDSGAYRRTIKRKRIRNTALVFSNNPMIGGWLEDGGERFTRRTRFRGYQVWSIAHARTDATAGAEARRLGADIARQLGGR